MALQFLAPEHTTFTKTICAEKILPAIVKYYIEARPRTGMWGFKLLHDNSPAYK